MARLGSLAVGALVGFALVFLGRPGLALGAVAGVGYIVLWTSRGAVERIGFTLFGGGGVVAVVTGRTVVTGLGDPAIHYAPDAILFMVAGAMVAGLGGLVAIVARDRSRSATDG